MKLAIHWFRRDLRVRDNTALRRAVQTAERVVPVFILEDALRTGPDVGATRLNFLLRSLEVLRETLRQLGYPLLVRSGRGEEEIPRLAKELGAQAVFCNKRYEPYAQARDARVFRALNAMGVGFEAVKDAVVWEESEILTQASSPYTVFTPYSKAWRARKIPNPEPAIAKRHPFSVDLPTESIPNDASAFGHHHAAPIPPAGEAAGLALLREFTRSKLAGYIPGRDFPAQDGTSRLSPHLRCGTVGVRTILEAVRASLPGMSPEGKRSADAFINELVWREFYLQILYHFPHVARGPFRPEYENLEWTGPDDHFTAWCQGRTGYPMVDAAMRSLNATGWMHNRARMIVAMFLTKDLLIDWRRGERYFMQRLVDGDMAANNGGWQWSAGTGTDAAPYFRIFNPVTQGRKFDPEGEFIRQWVPELRDLSPKQIHEPWLEANLFNRYSDRIVKHEEQRPKALAMYGRIQKSTAPRAN